MIFEHTPFHFKGQSVYQLLFTNHVGQLFRLLMLNICVGQFFRLLMLTICAGQLFRLLMFTINCEIVKYYILTKVIVLHLNRVYFLWEHIFVQPGIRFLTTPCTFNLSDD